MRWADRMSRLGTESAFEVLARARALEAQGRRIIHLEIGEPDFNTPAPIVEAAVKALREGWHHYTPSAGIRELREAIAEEISSSRNLRVDPDEVVVTPGGKPIIFFTLLALVQGGDEVIYPDPGFPIYESMIPSAFAQPPLYTPSAPSPLPGLLSSGKKGPLPPLSPRSRPRASPRFLLDTFSRARIDSP